ncbi:syntaxin binding protein [Plasmodium gonderi]|uniref:Syntaxin binding protein n=1 Tax=Plasmodium gonderi TaxID=77519 RepID=A0A1Y1JH85_PLAGO|nr:syntaxin binding protein [Plasmodium gonderi]GAW81886.1 syntaxin binding protein [Plasmodium gonderi]
MSLKENCKERVLSVIEKITEVSKYVVMVVDKKAYRILSMICKDEELLEMGVSLIELIDAKRSRLQDFDCLYFISSNVEVVEMMLSDFREEKNAKYKNVHILFTSNVGDRNREILDIIATSDFILKKIKSCACINIHFFAYESRIFYFDNNLNLYDYYPLKKSTILHDLSLQLLSVCSCLKSNPHIRFQNSPLCRKFAEIFYNSMNNSTACQGYNNNDDDVILILDRSIDCSILFIHDYSYQSLCYDILQIKTYHEVSEEEGHMENEENETRYGHKKQRNVNIGEGAHCVSFEITNNDQRKEEKKAILSEDDSLWFKYRHAHIQEVNEMIKNEISSFTEKNALVKIKKKNVLNPNEALHALRSLPQYETMIEQYWLHVYMCDNCFQVLQKRNIVDIGMVEQDICCNVDNYGKELSHSKNFASINSIISSNNYEQEEKARLILLYFINYENLNEDDKIKMMETAELGLFMQKFIVEFLKLKLHCEKTHHYNHHPMDEHSSSTTKIFHVLDKNKKKIKYYKNVAKNSKYELSRHEPNIKDIIIEMHHDTLNKALFPFVDNNRKMDDSPEKNISSVKKQNVTRGTVWEFKTEENNPMQIGNKKKIILFIIGGITFPEIRQIYELSEQLHVDIYLGGTSLLTSGVLFDQFKKIPSF